MARSKKQSHKQRRLGLQNLETRKMMAGDISVDVDISGSRIDVELTGDGAANGVEVRQINDTLRITGLNHGGAATTIEGNSALNIPTKQFISGSWRTLDDLTIKLGNGDDYVVVRDVNMQHHSHSDLRIETGAGNDRITMLDVDVLRNMRLLDHSSDDGNDYWWMRNVDIGGRLEADMGDGADTFVASYTDADEMDIDSGRHNDYVSLFGIDVDSLVVNLRSGNDTLRIDASDADAADLDGGDNHDTLDVNGTGFYANAFDAVLASEDFETIYA
ncbi:hypothetical protein Mal15_47210 [Stieleria maiorica]|uniref:Planctomycete extracellular domain-containing protein n=1 Tax=Stieleria maiorica TaxID=2795974 RepID=A0A5B9MJN0_9BACT|nr:hypothetical protein [Stieleria maiorica]QEG00650.1 hypothetical protein Mal15_47210 [Stieleria maiorica]